MNVSELLSPKSKKKIKMTQEQLEQISPTLKKDKKLQQSPNARERPELKFEKPLTQKRSSVPTSLEMVRPNPITTAAVAELNQELQHSPKRVTMRRESFADRFNGRTSTLGKEGEKGIAKITKRPIEKLSESGQSHMSHLHSAVGRSRNGQPDSTPQTP